MKTYTGHRTEDGCIVMVSQTPECVNYRLPPRLDLANHSPTGFEWGYGGSGPAQLALALLADALKNDKLAVARHQDFKWGFVAQLGRDEEWQISDARIRQLITEIA